MSVFSTVNQVPGPCRYVQTNRKQNRFCKRDAGMSNVLKEMRRLAVTHCEEQFRYDRWNCSVESSGKRNIFKKVYRETAFVHAITAAALTHAISRACSDGSMTRCQCAGEKKPEETRLAWRWGGCSDNLKHGKRMARNFLNLHELDSDKVAEILRHDSEVGIQVVGKTMVSRCKCHGVSGSCSMKTCYRKVGGFNATAALLRLKYFEAVRKRPSNKQVLGFEMKKKSFKVGSGSFKQDFNKELFFKQDKRTLDTLYYMETSPTFCSVTRGRDCLNPAKCDILCCGRGYNTRVIKIISKCRCRFINEQIYQISCDICEKYEDRYFCK